jgi:hypothetical protein
MRVPVINLQEGAIAAMFCCNAMRRTEMKTRVATMLALLALGISANTAVAQPSPGMGQGMGAGMGPGARWNMTQGNTPGYALMTPQERTAHQAKMRSMKTYDECKSYIDQHHAMMESRAKEKGKKLMVMRTDPCGDMKAMGRVK